MSSSGPTEDELAQQARSWGRITNLSRQLESFGITLNNTYYIDKPKFTIGRNPNNDLVLSHQGISGSHCVIESNNDYSFLIQDNSTNGTYVNGQRIQRGQKLEFDWGARVDIVRLGQARITFVISATKGKTVLLHNKFLVRSHLGNGAYAKVQLVYNLEDRQQYALKNIDRKLFGTGNVQGGESTLLNEVRILKTMNHYGVVRAYDHYINDSRFYIVLDYVPGGDLLDRLIERRKPLPPEEAKDIFVQLTEAIAYLHDHGVVHRDIKPENILIDDREYYRLLAEQKKVPQFSQSQGESQPSTQREMSKKTDETTKERYRITDEIEKEYRNQPSLGASNLRVKLTDFGLSKQMNLDGPEKTTTLERFNTQDYDDAQLKIQTNLKPFTTACGTPQYLAPEVLKIFIAQQQGKRGPVNQASVGYGREVDLWSLGAILYVMLTLHTPFDEATLYEQAPLGNYQRQRVEKMPQDILALLDGLFQPDPAKRYTIADVKANPWCADLFEQRARELEEKGSVYSQSQMQKRRDEKNRMDQLQLELDKEEAKRNFTNNNNNNNKNNNLAMTMTDTVLGANDQVQLPRPSKPSLMHDDSLAPMSSGDGTNTGTKRKTNDHNSGDNRNNNNNNNNYNNNNNNQNRHITDDDTNAQHTNKRQRPN